MESSSKLKRLSIFMTVIVIAFLIVLYGYHYVKNKSDAEILNNYKLMLEVPIGSFSPNQKEYPVGFIDSGIDMSHPQVEDRITDVRDFTGEGVQDDYFHGTGTVLVYLRSKYTDVEYLQSLKHSNINENPVGDIFVAKVTGKKITDHKEIMKRYIDALHWLNEKNVLLVFSSVTFKKNDSNDSNDYKLFCKEIEKFSLYLIVPTGNVRSGEHVVDVYPGACKLLNIDVIGAKDSNGKRLSYSGRSPSGSYSELPPKPVDASKYFIEMGRRHLKNKSYNASSEAFNKALVYTSNSDVLSNIYYFLGVIEYENKNIESSIRYYTESIEYNYSNTFSNASMAQIYESKKEYSKAEKYLRNIVENKDVTNNIILFYGMLLMDLNKPELAIEKFKIIPKSYVKYDSVSQSTNLAKDWIKIKKIKHEERHDYLKSVINENMLVLLPLLNKEGWNLEAPITDYGHTPLNYASAKGMGEIANLLLDYGVNPNFIKHKYEYSSLMIASERGFDEIVDLLIKYKADINAVDYNNKTALMYAAMEGKESVVKKLINSGAKLDVLSNDGKSAYDYAVINNHESIVKILAK